MNQSLRDIQSLLLKLAIALLAYPVCKIIFFLFNHSHFADISLLGLLKILFFGLRFDLSALVLINLPFIVLHSLPFAFTRSKIYQLFLKSIFLITNGISLLADCMDMEYYKYTLKRTTYDFFDLMGLGSDFITMLPRYILDFWYILLLWATLLFLLSYFYNKTKNNAFLMKTAPNTNRWKAWILRFTSWLVLNVVLIGLMIIAFRGGLQLRPIMPINAAEYVPANTIPLILNTPFSIIKSYGLEELDEKKYFSEEELIKEFNPIKQKTNTATAPFNVCVIILESFSKEYTSLGNKQSHTPFLDSLMKESLVFDNAFANGKRSIEGVPAIIAGMPSLMNESFITSAYCSNQFNALPNMLKEKGYSSAFFHGGINGTMGFDAFCKSAGFENYYGRFEYNNDADYDGEWGIWDEPFLQYSSNKINEMKEPFCVSIFTLSSHHPYTIPKKYADVFKGGKQSIYKCIEYADFSLKKFFETASKQEWFNNTLFVITADHTGASDDTYFSNNIGGFEIPIIYYKPGSALKGLNHNVTQQIDILPTVITMTGTDKDYVSFGNNALDSGQNSFAVSYINGIYQLIQNNFLLQFDGTSTIGLFNYKSDSLLHNNLINTATIKEKAEMETKLKAIIQTYYSAMIHNKLSADNYHTPTPSSK